MAHSQKSIRMAGGGFFSPTLKSMKEVTTLRAQEWIHSEESAKKIPPANLLNPIGILKALRADRHSHSRARLLLRLRVPVLGELDGASYAPGLKEKDLLNSTGAGQERRMRGESECRRC